MCDNVGVAGLWWDDEDADYIRSRSDRYPGALNIEPEWTLDHSPGAGFVLTVIVDPVDLAGITAWKARGVDLCSYLEGEAVNDD
ncbi:MAG: hypothetical protein WB735_14175 [Pseudonocardiaceae bacterium]